MNTSFEGFWLYRYLPCLWLLLGQQFCWYGKLLAIKFLSMWARFLCTLIMHIVTLNLFLFFRTFQQCLITGGLMIALLSCVPGISSQVTGNRYALVNISICSCCFAHHKFKTRSRIQASPSTCQKQFKLIW